MNNPTTRRFTAADGVPFHVDIWEPRGEPHGRIVVLHGIRSHAGWYGASCAKFAEAGYRVLFVERRGAGRNRVNRGDAPGFRTLVDDVAQVIEADAREVSETATTLLGISWGGKIALATVLRKPGLVRNLVLIAPGFTARIRPALPVRLRMIAARVANPTKRFPIPLNDPELFTSDAEKQDWLRTNPHDLHEATARFFVSSAMLDRFLKSRFASNPVPTLTLLAGDDRIIDNEAVRRQAAAFPVGIIREYPGRAHTLEFEDANLGFVDDVVAWLDAQPKRPRM